MDNPQLTVYKASAGSGKTFTLACEYMTLVIDNPMTYRNILAVTFTNKATEEMKTRILSQLYGIAHQLPESKGYSDHIQKALPHLSLAQITANAAAALSLLLHNYNYFRVETIDTFFQSVLRNLARELDLTANLRIELNDYQVEQQAVDQLIEDLNHTDKLLFWIMDYIKENIAEDKSWNVIGQIKQLGEHIFKDYYKENADKLNACFEQEDFFKVFKQKMNKMKQDATEHFEQIAATFFDTLEENMLTINDFNYKQSGVAGYFIKLRNGIYDDDKLLTARVLKAMESEEGWVKKSAAKPGNPAYDCTVSSLLPLLRYSEECRPRLLRLYKSACQTMRHLNQLRLLGSIDQKVRALNQDANRFLLSDTQTLLHSIIQDSDSPFIFEKIGTQLEHVMIDEFQDTSTIQWQNFKVLLQETMSHKEAGNLIVGDVKQSIYRWRDGDWKLLNNIESQFANQQLEVKSLDTNYRSARNIIEFNNAFFQAAASCEYETLHEDLPQESEQLKNAYSDVVQKVPSKKAQEGYVNIHLIAKEDKDEKMLELTQQTIDCLMAQGAAPKDIAILVRGNKQIQSIAEYLQSKGNYPLVSDEALRLDASQAVLMLVTALRLLAHPEDNITRATLRQFASQFLSGDAVVTALEENREQLLQTPLFDLIEHLYVELQLGEIKEMKDQSSYLCSFYDQLNAYLQDNSSDIEAFLKEWDNSIHQKSIHSDNADGIRLVTIHKSKGLEFEHVIIPFCDWKLELSSTLWCTPTVEPFSQLPLVPIDFNAKQMVGSIYEDDYYREHLQNMVDNMNLLYVAFTRASRSLYVIGCRNNANYRSALIENVLENVAHSLGDKGPNISLEGIGSDSKTEDILFEYGRLEFKDTNQETTLSANVFTQPSEMIQVPHIVNPTMPVFRQSNKSRDFIEGDEDEEQQKYYIKLGTVLHNVFSTIRTTADIKPALHQLELDGMLYDENVSRERLERMISKRLLSKQVAYWFSDHWTLFNECSILSVEEGKVVEHRPDRVMKDEERTIIVDFKFGKPKDEHIVQVREYMRLIASMDSSTAVEGYLWYVYPNKIEKVTL